MEAIKRWLNRQLANPQVALLGVLLLVGIAVIFLFGDMLAPFFASVVIAYLLDGIVIRMQRHHIPRLLAVIIVFIGFLVVILLISFVLVPNVVNQLQNLTERDVPRIVRATSKGMESLQIRYDELRKTIFPDLFSQSAQSSATNSVSTNLVQRIDESPPETSNASSRSEGGTGFPEIQRLTDTLEKEITKWGTMMVNILLNSLKNLVVWVVYLVLVPVLVFFLLKDKERILAWLIQFLPKDRSLASQIWHDVNAQTSNYIRGKFWEIILVWVVTHLAFRHFGLNFALLLSLFVGLTVIVPYLGSAIMYIPITLVAFYQFGWGSTLFWILVVYTIIQIIDGNVLAPILLSEVTSLHPVAVIVAILIFGGLWGFWGVFFAIPLATLVNAVIKAWPKEFSHPPRSE